MAEPVEMPFGMLSGVCPRKHLESISIMFDDLTQPQIIPRRSLVE